MKKRLLLFGLVLNLFLTAQPQNELIKTEERVGATTRDTTKVWQWSGIYSATMAQTSLTNWAAGGNNNLNVNGLVRQLGVMTKGKWVWNNLLEANLGYNFQDIGTLKTDDKLEFTTRLDREFNKPDWRFSFYSNFKTQFFDGFANVNDANRISTFMAPAYLVYGAGITNTSIPGMSIYLSPLQVKNTFVLDDSLYSHGVFFPVTAPNITVLGNGGGMRWEVGAFLDVFYKKVFNDNFQVNSRLNLFSNYLDKPQNIDVNWEAIFLLKVYRNIAVSLQLQLIYDHDVNVRYANNSVSETYDAPGTQFKQILGVGLSYSYGAFKK